VISSPADEGSPLDESRAIGAYKLQVTSVDTPDAATADTDDPATGWATIGVIEYRNAFPPDFNPHLRHRFDVSAGGIPIDATGLRIKVSNGAMDIDEIEVNTLAQVPPPHLTVSHSDSSVVVSWTGGGGLEWAPKVNGPWTCLGTAGSPYTVTIGAQAARFYRIRR